MEEEGEGGVRCGAEASRRCRARRGAAVQRERGRRCAQRSDDAPRPPLSAMSRTCALSFSKSASSSFSIATVVVVAPLADRPQPAYVCLTWPCSAWSISSFGLPDVPLFPFTGEPLRAKRSRRCAASMLAASDAMSLSVVHVVSKERVSKAAID